MRIRDGLHPAYIDKDVRFRTTYYFRSFDWCHGKNLLDGEPNVVILPETDSLYRFRMTGKAQALFTRVIFESGTLPAAQIDPFGAKIQFDDKLNGFRFASQQEVDAQIRRQAAEEDLDRLFKLLDQIDSIENADQAKKKALSNKIIDLITKNAGRLTLEGYETNSNQAGRDLLDNLESLANTADPDTPANDDLDNDLAGAPVKKSDNPSLVEVLEGRSRRKLYEFLAAELNKILSETNERTQIKNLDAFIKFTQELLGGGIDQITCPANAPIQRGFQILGPEGWRTFNQDERLIMAMSTSDKPIIGVMQEYSERILNAKADGASQNLILTEEHLRLVRAQREFDRAEFNDDKTAQEAFENAIAFFATKEAVTP